MQGAHLQMVCNRSKALLLGIKNGNACGLEATPGHADAAVAYPVLQHHSKSAGRNLHAKAAHNPVHLAPFAGFQSANRVW